ncbi:hypothetical protein CEXT_314361 [Caerostris extrusa]|uniref:Uncharacterized protein n=1 Tax=Caerostris extrusa TaxID=172846 RepID=A0AAV4V3N6_CAEEX|nr:hypothetical protein CEXT_314361 [Caerostris extrusa]
MAGKDGFESERETSDSKIVDLQESRSTGAQVAKKVRDNSEVKGLRAVRIKIGNTNFVWEIPVDELIRIDLGERRLSLQESCIVVKRLQY